MPLKKSGTLFSNKDLIGVGLPHGSYPIRKITIEDVTALASLQAGQ